MEKKELVEGIRELVSQHPRHVGEEYNPEIQDLVVRYARQCRQEGQTWAKIAIPLPLTATTIRTWVQRAEVQEGEPAPSSSSPKCSEGDGGEFKLAMTAQTRVEFAPVLVTPEPRGFPSSQPVVVGPTGFRLEGLNLDEAIIAMRALT